MTTLHAKDVLQKEADARFWAQTQYRIGQRLDPGNAADRAMIPIWNDLLRKIRAEDARGELRLTYNDPDVERHLADAATASAAAAGHLATAAATEDPWAAAPHTAAASEATRAAATSARAAAAAQPASVSTVLADLAAAAAAAAGQIVHRTILDRLAPDHPALTSPAAQPALPHPDEPPPSAPPPPAPPQPLTAADHLAIAQAQATPDVAAEIHGADAARGAPPPPSQAMLHPQAVGDIRRVARKLADDSTGARFVGVVYHTDETWAVPIFDDPRQAAAWYRQIANSPDLFRYAAHFDKTDATSWPDPVNEDFGSSRGLGGGDASSAPTSRPDRGVSYKMIGIAGAIVAGGAVLVAATHHRRRRLA